MKDDYRNHVLPQDTAVFVYHLGLGDPFPTLGIGRFDVDVLGL